jgi:hypothetical protein
MPDTCQNRIIQDAVITLLTKTTLKGDINNIFSMESAQQQWTQLGLRMSIFDHTNTEFLLRLFILLISHKNS